MPHWPKPVGLLQNETSLQRMQAILERVGNPHKNLPPVIHVAGTNGKGSTIAFMKAMLEAEGKVVHAYTTPHLVKFNERIHLAGKNICDEFIFEVMEEVRVNAEDMRLGFYEATTTGAFLAFSRIEADYLLLETGLGGRLDATNIIDPPLMSILTTIDIDHTEFLGRDVQSIAREKLHIVKPGSKCISSLQHDIVNEEIENWCLARNIEHQAFGADFGIALTETGFRFISAKSECDLPAPALKGNHQYVNAASAIMAMQELGISQQAIEQGLQTVKWPSRLEQLNQPYIPEGWELWLDGAHNPSGAFALANYIEDNWQDKSTHLIFSTTRGRDVSAFLKQFAGKVQHVALVKINAEPNSYTGEEMLPAAQQLGFEASAHDSLKEALVYLHEANPTNARVLACGSLFMRGDI